MSLQLILVFQSQKRNQDLLLKEAMIRVERDKELQYILLSLDGASLLFQGDRIRYINRTFESVFIKSQK